MFYDKMIRVSVPTAIQKLAIKEVYGKVFLINWWKTSEGFLKSYN